MKYTVAAVMILALAVTSLNAGSFERPFFGRGLDNQSLLNPNNMRMNHSMSFMSGFSSDGEGFYQSVYTNHLSYRFSENLDLKVNVNFVNHGTTNWDGGFSFSSNNDNTNNVVPEFSLRYRPTDNSIITIEYRQAVSPYHSSKWRW